jgi:hypothetical protein
MRVLPWLIPQGETWKKPFRQGVGMMTRQKGKGLGGFTVAIGILLLVAAPALATSKDYCEDLLSRYKYPAKIQDLSQLPNYNTRELTQADKDTISNVLLRKCMLDADTLNENWDNKTIDQRKAYFTNYDLVTQSVTEQQYNTIFPNKLPTYPYASFVKSAMAFPFLCGENGETLNMCKKEFATMFAHWWQETLGLSVDSETGCGVAGQDCQYVAKTSYFYDERVSAADPDHQYFGRGPKQLSYNYNYGHFSWDFFNDMRFLENPYLLLSDQYKNVIFMSAFWFYMTPYSQKPSMHDVVTGIWQPNALDTAQHIASGFGATTSIINGGIECGKGDETVQSHNRIAYYQGGVIWDKDKKPVKTVTGTLQLLGLDPVQDPSLVQNTSCASQNPFPLGGAASLPLYYNHSRYWECELKYSEMAFTLYDYSGFKTSHGIACKDGLDCCNKVRAKLKTTQQENPPFGVSGFYQWIGLGTTRSVPATFLLFESE